VSLDDAEVRDSADAELLLMILNVRVMLNVPLLLLLRLLTVGL
jgi:hypothetical protein